MDDGDSLDASRPQGGLEEEAGRAGVSCSSGGPVGVGVGQNEWAL